MAGLEIAGNTKRYSVNDVSKIDALFTIPVAAELIPFPNAQALRQWLSTRKKEFPPLYRKSGMRTYRMLSEAEIRLIRSMMLTAEHPRERARGLPRGGILANIARKALL